MYFLTNYTIFLYDFGKLSIIFETLILQNAIPFEIDFKIEFFNFKYFEKKY